jgi:hypothetical protein
MSYRMPKTLTRSGHALGSKKKLMRTDYFSFTGLMLRMILLFATNFDIAYDDT